MNIVRVYGGLGNQLFQYAFGKLIECKGALVGYDFAWYRQKNKKYPRPLCLDKFNTRYTVGHINHRLNFVNEEGGHIVHSIDLRKEYNYLGYWQSPFYYENIYQVLQNEFKVKPEFYTAPFLLMRDKIQETNSVSIHVRRGDFLIHPSHHIVPLDYYKNAINLMKNLKSDPHFFVFSDDPKWCQSEFKGDEFTHVRMEDYLEFDLMRNCKSKIIGNSTFSWWPAYLTDGITICPKKWWVKDEANALTQKKGMLLDRWIKL